MTARRINARVQNGHGHLCNYYTCPRRDYQRMGPGLTSGFIPVAQWLSVWQDEIQRVTDAGLAAGKKNALMYLIAARQIASHPPQFLRDVLQKVHLLVS